MMAIVKNRGPVLLKGEAAYKYRPLAIAIKRALLASGAKWLTAH